MKKLLLLFCALLCLGGSRAWATDVIISDQSNLSTINSTNYSTTAAHKYGTYSAPAGGTTFTTNSTSGLSGVTITSTSNIVKPFYYSGAAYKYGLAFKPTDGGTYTITISAPENYVIIGYTMKAISTSQNQKFEVIASSGTYEVTSSQNYITGRVANQQSTTFTLRNKLNDGKAATQELCLPFFTITLLPSNDASVTKISDVSDLSKSKTYLIHSIDFSPSDLSRGYLSGTSGYLASTAKTGNWSPNSFAIIQYDDKYFLYDVSNKNYIRTENYSGTPDEIKGIETKTSILPLTIEKISNGVFKLKMGTNYLNFSSSYTYGLTINSHTTNDAGNNLELIESSSFDDTEAITTLEAYLANPSIVNGGKYKIKLNGTSFYISKDASGNAKTETTASELILSENGTNAAGKKAYSIKDAGTNKYLSYTDITYSGGANSRLSWADTDTNSKFVLTQGTGTYSTNILIRPADACDNNYVTSWNQNYSDQIFVFWTLSNTMSYWTLEKITKNVTYNLKWNGETIKTNSSVSVHIGGAAIDFVPWTVTNKYTSFTCDVTKIDDSTTEVNVTMNWDGPFDFSTDFASAVWYYMQINRDMWLSAGSTSEGVTSVVTGADLSTSDVALWAFIGNPCDGVKIINKSIGEGYYGQAGYDAFNISSADENTLLTIVKDEEKGLMFKNSAGKYMELLIDNGVAFVAFCWDTPYDDGNTNIITLRSYYCQKFIDDVYAWADANHRDEYFGPSEASLTTLQNNIISMFPKMTSSEYSSFTIPDDILPNIVMKYPSTGYYRIKNNGTGDYLAYGQPAAPHNEKTPGLIAISSANVATDFSSIIKLTGSSGTYKLSTEGLNVQSQTTGNQAFPATSSEGANFEFTSANKNGIVSITNADSRVDDNKDGSLHNATGWTVNGVVNWSASASNSKWLIEDATTVTVPLTYISDNNASYATLYLPFGATITGAKAYILTVSGEWAIPSEITEIPANTGVLLRAEGNVASATVTIKDDASAETAGNMLDGTNVDITAARSTGEYILGNGEDGLGFYQRGSGRKIGANKAYLQLDADLAAGVKGLLLNFDIATGIDGLTPDPSLSKKGEEIFNLAGQRMSRVQKGVNIVNGKKVLVK